MAGFRLRSSSGRPLSRNHGVGGGGVVEWADPGGRLTCPGCSRSSSCNYQLPHLLNHFWSLISPPANPCRPTASSVTRLLEGAGAAAVPPGRPGELLSVGWTTIGPAWLGIDGRGLARDTPLNGESIRFTNVAICQPLIYLFILFCFSFHWVIKRAGYHRFSPVLFRSVGCTSGVWHGMAWLYPMCYAFGPFIPVMAAHGGRNLFPVSNFSSPLSLFLLLFLINPDMARMQSS